MSKFIILLALVAFVAAAPVAEEEEAKVIEVVPILRSESDRETDGSYSFSFESGDGNAREEKAVVINAGTDEETIKITGSYKYIDADGETVVVNYTADENGFVPVGSNIPKEISDNAFAAKDLPKPEVKTETSEE